MDYAISTPDTIANAMVAALNQPAEFKPVESDGGHARRAHARRSPLIQCVTFRRRYVHVHYEHR